MKTYDVFVVMQIKADREFDAEVSAMDILHQAQLAFPMLGDFYVSDVLEGIDQMQLDLQFEEEHVPLFDVSMPVENYWLGDKKDE